MATSIQVADETLRELKALKENLHASSYDEVLQRLIMTHRKRTMKVRGATRYIGPFVRDHNDRD